MASSHSPLHIRLGQRCAAAGKNQLPLREDQGRGRLLPHRHGRRRCGDQGAAAARILQELHRKDQAGGKRGSDCFSAGTGGRDGSPAVAGPDPQHAKTDGSPDMPTKAFTNGRIRKAVYDTASQQLDLHWDNKSILAYKHVPQEVYRRLCSAPNPATYWEDRIADEYPKGTPMTSNADPDGARKLSDLFGGGEGEGSS